MELRCGQLAIKNKSQHTHRRSRANMLRACLQRKGPLRKDEAVYKAYCAHL